MGKRAAVVLAVLLALVSLGQRAASGQQPSDLRTPPPPATPT
jgi:negative regulator of sigma E activity